MPWHVATLIKEWEQYIVPLQLLIFHSNIVGT